MGSRIPPRKPVRAPQKMVNPRVLTPVDQISPHYGGRDRTLAAIQDARELAGQLTAVDDIDGSYRRAFPEVMYGRYENDLLINPVPEDMLVEMPIGAGDPDAGVLTFPEELAPGGQIQMRTGDFIEAPELAEEMPSISFGQEIPDKEVFGLSTSRSPGGQIDDALRGHSQAQRQGSIGRSVEEPMTEYVTGGFGMGDEEFDPTIIDPILAQMRRTAGADVLEPDAARNLIGGAMDRYGHYAKKMMKDDPLDFVMQEVAGITGRDALDAQTGLTMAQLRYLSQLPSQVIAMLPKRIRELLTLGGVTTGLLSAGGSSDRKSIDPRSTTGPLSGLTDF